MEIKKLAALIDGKVESEISVEILGLNGVESAKSGDLTFALDEEKLTLAEQGDASCILTDMHIRRSSKPLIRVKNPKLSFLIVYNTFYSPESRKVFVHPSASIAATARIGKDVWIGSHVSIEDNVTIGDHTIIESNSVIKKNSSIGALCHIFPNVTVYENSILKKNVILHGGAVVGSDGFGYVKDNGKIYKFPQLGRVIIEDDVEIGSNTTIDRGSLSDTTIGEGTKIDNLCQIAHNVKIGKNVIMAAQCGISGSAVIGDNVTMGGQSGIVDNVTIGEGVRIGAKSAVIGNVKNDEIVWGIPARPIGETKRQMAVLSWLTRHFKALSKSLK